MRPITKSSVIKNFKKFEKTLDKLENSVKITLTKQEQLAEDALCDYLKPYN